MREIITQLLSWYLVVQLCGLVALPLTLTLFTNLPDRGYAFAKSLGIFLVGLIFWLGYSYGLLRNEAGGAWLALLLVGGASLFVGRSLFTKRTNAHQPRWGINLFYVFSVEVLFLVAFIAWAMVRAHDPAVNHTEQPMDLMFMNGIWNSATYPPQDPWLAGYAISYYYFGYWLQTMLARLSGLSTAVAYNVGQACWYGLLLTGCYGVVVNLLAVRAAESDPLIERVSADGRLSPMSMPVTSLLGGLIGAIAVGVVGNLQSIFEYLVTSGRSVSRLVAWFDVYNFAENATASSEWHVDFGWWWWRSSRVIEDLDLNGNHIEIIDEFPMFSYILGDNHPHVLAMPFVLLVIALAFNLLLHRPTVCANDRSGNQDDSPKWTFVEGFVDFGMRLTSIVPLNLLGLFILVATTGGLFFFNSWDFPPYWLLMMLVALATLAMQRTSMRETTRLGLSAKPPVVDVTDVDATEAESPDSLVDSVPVGETARKSIVATPQVGRAPNGVNAWGGALLFGGLIFIGMLLLYAPYFLTAQSQAGGLVPNVFHPTKFRQFFLMFGFFLPSIVALVLLAWREHAPSWSRLGTVVALTLGLPILFLVLSTVLGAGVPAGERFLGILVSPNSLFENGGAVLGRRLAAPWTFLIMGLLLATVIALLWERLVLIQASGLTTNGVELKRSLLFVLLLAAVGLLLTFAPEFVYLRDNFGTRMNTVFKFYYQAWLLFGLCTAYVIMVAFRGRGGVNLPAVGLASLSLLLMIGCLFFPIAGVYSKTNGFGTPTEALTLDATAHVTTYRPAERAAIDWVAQNTGPTTVVLEGKGASYRAEYSMMSTMTGRPTLLGWDGHESQWRGRAYGEMANGRGEVLETVYRNGSATQIAEALTRWGVEYVYVGPTERAQYEISPRREEVFAQALELAFDAGGVQVYALRR